MTDPEPGAPIPDPPLTPESPVEPGVPVGPERDPFQEEVVDEDEDLDDAGGV
jgi:hypothetical protein